MLVYLDTACFDRLQRATENELTAFLSEWDDLGCDLAISMTNAIELSPLTDESFRSRLEIIDRFPRIRICFFRTEDVVEAEMQIQAQHLLDGAEGSPDYSVLRNIFEPAVDREFSMLVPLWRDQMRSEREAHVALAGMLDAVKRTGRRPNRRWPRRMGRILDHATMDRIRRSAQEIGGDDGEAVAFAQRFFEKYEMAKLGSTSDREALLKLMPVVEPFTCMRRAPLEDFWTLNVAATRLRNLFHRGDVRPPRNEGELDALQGLDFYDAPALSVRLAVDRHLQRSGQRLKASSLFDVVHVMFAPYVHLCFVDKRTLAFYEQALRAEPQYLPRSAMVRIRRFTDLDGILHEVRLLAAE
jgi:hypothetical protein